MHYGSTERSTDRPMANTDGINVTFNGSARTIDGRASAALISAMAGFLSNFQSQGRQVALGLGGTLGAALLGLAAYAIITADSRECVDSIASATASANMSKWEDVKEPLQRARAACGPRRAGEIAALTESVRKNDALDAANAKAGEAKHVADVADKERTAIAGWPDGIEAIRNAIKSATVALSKGSLEKAAPPVKTARAYLDDYAGTSIAKGDSWIALDAKTTELEAKVKPYVDQLAATMAAARALTVAEDAKDRAAGYVETKENFVVSTDLAKVEKAIKYLAGGDQEGFTLYIHSDPEIAVTRPGVRVRVFDHGGFAGSYSHIRVKGTLTELWINQKGLAAF